MLKYFRNTIAFCLSVVLFCACISVPITGNAATPQARSLRFLVLYDESYMTSLDDTTGRDTSSRLGEAFWYASLPFYEKWNISIDFDFYKYDDVIGVPYSASIQYPDSCLGMWSWTTQNNQNVRSWIFLTVLTMLTHPFQDITQVEAGFCTILADFCLMQELHMMLLSQLLDIAYAPFTTIRMVCVVD